MDLDDNRTQLEGNLERTKFVLRLRFKFPLVNPSKSLLFLVAFYRREVVFVDQRRDVKGGLGWMLG